MVPRTLPVNVQAITATQYVRELLILTPTSTLTLEDLSLQFWAHELSRSERHAMVILE